MHQGKDSEIIFKMELVEGVIIFFLAFILNIKGIRIFKFFTSLTFMSYSFVYFLNPEDSIITIMVKILLFLSIFLSKIVYNYN